MERLLGPKVQRPELRGRSVLVAESDQYASFISRFLSEFQHMKGHRTHESSFIDGDIAHLMRKHNFDSLIAHIPCVQSDEAAREALDVVRRVLKICPRVLIFEGYPVTQETYDFYQCLRLAGVAMVLKSDSNAGLTIIVEELAKLFREHP